MLRLSALLSILLGAIPALPANGRAIRADGVIITEKAVAGRTTTINQIHVRGDKARVERFSLLYDEVLLYDGAADTLYLINYTKKNHVKMARDFADRYEKSVQDRVTKDDETRAGYTPEQRRLFDRQNPDRDNGFTYQAVKTVYKPSGSATVGRWTCNSFEGTRASGKVAEMCTVPEKTVGLTDAELGTLGKLAELYRKLVFRAADDVPHAAREDVEGFAGFAVKRYFLFYGWEVRTEVTSVARGDVPDSVFAIPANFPLVRSPEFQIVPVR